MNDTDLELLRAATPVWDELREQRVLGRVEAQLASQPLSPGVAPKPTTVRTSAKPPAWQWWIAAAAAVVLCVAAGATWWVTRAAGAPVAPSTVAAAVPEALPVESEPSTLRLPDGSVAQMDARAHVDVEVQSDALVRLLQTRGSVRYDVARDATREFVVEVGDVQVRVLGTAFTITREAAGETAGDTAGDREMMSVEVHHGRVEVRRGERRTELGKGETLRMDLHAPDIEGDPPTETGNAETGEADVIVVEDASEAEPAVRTERGKAGRKPASAGTLLLRADEARADGRLGDAATALRELLRHHKKDTRAYSAWFQLGKVERARGRHGAAAAAFARCAKRSPGGALSEDARAEAAASWRAAGKTQRAHDAAQTYLDRHAQGTHVARMRRILASPP